MGAGLLVFLLRKGSHWVKLRNVALVTLALGVIMIVNLSLEMNRRRWEKTLEGGTLAGREVIYPAAWKMFLEKPLVGWGPATHYYVLGSRFFREKLDTHNLFLWLLTQVGLLGFIPYCAGLVLCFKAAWKARSGPLGILPLALLVVALVVNMSLTWLEVKVYWLILALALASASPIGVRHARQRLRRPVGTARRTRLAGTAFTTR